MLPVFRSEFSKPSAHVDGEKPHQGNSAVLSPAGHNEGVVEGVATAEASELLPFGPTYKAPMLKD